MIVEFLDAEKVCFKIFDGTHESPKARNRGRLMITSKNLQSNSIDFSGASLISEDDFQKIQKRSRVKQWDILFSMIGSVGRVYLEESSNPDYAIKNIGVFSCGSEELARKLYYYFQTPFASNYIKSSCAGAIQKFLSLKELKKFPIPTYLNESLVKVLTLIDQKISINLEINRNLEALVRQLYDYWFVQFDFPDENGRPYKSSGGKIVKNEFLGREIPVHWTHTTIERYADIHSGATPPTSVQSNYGGDVIWITPKDLSDQSQKFTFKGERAITTAGYNSCSTTLLPKGTVLMSSRAPIGLLSIAATELCTNQGFKNLVPKRNKEQRFLYYLVSQHLPIIKQMGGGTTFHEISRDQLSKLKVPNVPSQIIEYWDLKVKPIFDKQELLLREIDVLTQQRDELLPLLMNGQVSIISPEINCDLSRDL